MKIMEKQISVKLVQDIGFPVRYALNAEPKVLEEIEKECLREKGGRTSYLFESKLRERGIKFSYLPHTSETDIVVDIQSFGERLDERNLVY